MSRKIIYLCFSCLILFACRKENPNPQWDIDVLGPVLHASLSIDELIADSILTADSSGAEIISYDQLLSTFNLDTLAQVKDTSIRTISVFPPFAATIHPGDPFIQNNNNIVLGLNGLQLKKSIVASGKIRIDIKNTLHSKIYFTYTIPKALKNNLPFTVNAIVDSASITNPKYFSGEFDLAGYSLDLTGNSGNTFNTISYNVRAVADPNGYPFNVAGSDTVVNLTTTLESMTPSYAQGYLGQEVSNSTSDNYIDLNKLFVSGILKLDSVKVNIDLTNYIGADAQFYINKLQSVNSRTGMNVDLVAPSAVQHSVNINRASETSYPWDPIVPTNYSIQLDKTNSNVVSFLENLPDKIHTDFSLHINPLGNVSGSNDFIYTDYLLDTRLRVLMPLRFAMNQLVLLDTVPFNISNSANFTGAGPLTLSLVANNGFPMDLNVQLLLLNNTNTVIDSLFVPDFIARAPVDINYRAQGKTQTIIKIPIDAARKDRILSVQNVIVRIRFNTPDYPQLIQMYSDYKLDLKLIADGIYSIR